MNTGGVSKLRKRLDMRLQIMSNLMNVAGNTVAHVVKHYRRQRKSATTPHCGRFIVLQWY